jgi:hypothetical protein
MLLSWASEGLSQISARANSAGIFSIHMIFQLGNSDISGQKHGHLSTKTLVPQKTSAEKYEKKPGEA